VAVSDPLHKRALKALKDVGRKVTGTERGDIELPFRKGFDTRDKRLPRNPDLGQVAAGIKAIRSLPDETRRRVEDITRNRKR